MAKQSFAQHLQEAREAAGLSQFELARLAGIPQRQISAIESGTRDQSWKVAIALIEACGGTITVQKPKASVAGQCKSRPRQGTVQGARQGLLSGGEPHLQIRGRRGAGEGDRP